MKAMDLEYGDVVIFPNGNVAKVLVKYQANASPTVEVMYDSFTTEYRATDQLLVAREGRVL